MPIFSIPKMFCKRSPAGILRPCSRTTNVRQTNATIRTGENNVAFGVETGRKDGAMDAIEYSAKTSEFPAA